MKQNKSPETSLIMPVTTEFIKRRIYVIRGQKVMLDSDLAELYQVPTMRLNEQVKRNLDRFPEDFMFQLDKKQFTDLISQNAISSWGGRRTMPYAFTELGVAMLSSVLKSERAVQMNIYIMRAFMKLREMVATHNDLAHKIAELERGQKAHSKHLASISTVLKEMLNEPVKPKEKIGFRRD